MTQEIKQRSPINTVNALVSKLNNAKDISEETLLRIFDQMASEFTVTQQEFNFLPDFRIEYSQLKEETDEQQIKTRKKVECREDTKLCGTYASLIA